MSEYVFANGWLSTLAAPIAAGATSLTPTSTVNAPLCDPTAVVPTISALIIDCDPSTGLPTATSEIVTVTDTRSTPWTFIPADETVAFGVAQGAPVNHAAGAPIAFVASAAALDALVNPSIDNLTGTSLMSSAVAGDVLTKTGGGVWQPQAPTVPSLAAGTARNASGTADAHSTIPGAPYLFGNQVKVTDGSGNDLTAVVDANIGRDVELTASVPMSRDANTDANLFVYLIIVETTAGADLSAANLHAVNFQSAPIPVPTTPVGAFQASINNCWLSSSEFPIQRRWALTYVLFNPLGTTTANGRWVQASNAADAYPVYISNVALTSNVATLTTFNPHYFQVGDAITVGATLAAFTGSYTVASVPTPTTLTYAKTNANVASTPSFGLVTPTAPRVPGPVQRVGTRFAAVLH